MTLPLVFLSSLQHLKSMACADDMNFVFSIVTFHQILLNLILVLFMN